MPEILRVFGMRFFFFANNHLPIHVHVQNTEGRAKFYILPTVQIAYNKGLKTSAHKLAEAVIEENKDLIIRKWEEFYENNR
jgi:ribosome recycling factor